MTAGDRDRERRVDEALRRLAQVEPPEGLRSRIEAALDARQATASGAGALVRLRPRPAHVALLAATVVLCVTGWWWLARPGLLPSQLLAGADPTTAVPLPLAATVVMSPARPAAAQPPRRVPAASALAAPVPPAQSARTLTINDDLSLPPLPEPPEKQFDDVAPAPLVLAQLDEPAPIEIEPLVFADAPPDDDAGAGDSRW